MEIDQKCEICQVCENHHLVCVCVCVCVGGGGDPSKLETKRSKFVQLIFGSMDSGDLITV